MPERRSNAVSGSTPRPGLLAIDEVGYLSYSNRHADLLYEVVSRRYQQKSTVITTNKAFGEWNEIFPNASCVVTLIDRLVHRSEIVKLAGESYRLKEAKERAAKRGRRGKRGPTPGDRARPRRRDAPRWVGSCLTCSCASSRMTPLRRDG